MKKIKISFTIFFLLVFNIVLAQSAGQEPGYSFRNYADISINKNLMKSTSVVELDLGKTPYNSFAVYDLGNGRFIPSLLFKDYKEPKLQVLSGGGDNPEALTDKSYQSFSSFDTDGQNMQKSEIVLNIEPESSFDAIKIILDKNVSLPNYVLIYDTNNAQTLLARSPELSNIIKFPETKTGQIAIRFEHIQPLRISELEIISKKSELAKKRLRFLAEPGNSYRIFAAQDYYEPIKYSEAPDLYSDKDVIKLDIKPAFKENPFFKELDSDNDGILDKNDNCVNLPNPKQEDLNQNGRGDACDDFDKDGVINSRDNCPSEPNYAQTDSDRDGIGDACDKEESRILEKYPWLIWLGVGLVVLMFLAMATVIIKKKPEELNKNTEENSKNSASPTQNNFD